MREVINGLLYLLWTGCQWQALPKDLPPKSTVHHYFKLWNWDGTLERFSPEHACEIELWLLDKEKELSDKDKEACPTETRRLYTIRDGTVVAAWAGVVATIGSAIVVWPVLIKGSWCAIDAQVDGIVRQYLPDNNPVVRTGAHPTFPIFEVCAVRQPVISETIERPIRARPAHL
jgi:hypothetical protein